MAQVEMQREVAEFRIFRVYKFVKMLYYMRTAQGRNPA